MTVPRTPGRSDDAERSLRRAIEAQEAAFARTPGVARSHESVARHWHHLGRALRARGKPEEALAVARAFRGKAKGRPEDLYDVACDFSVCVPLVRADLKAAVADEAMGTLREAVAAGWSRPAHAATDANLVSIRQRDDFRGLLEALMDRNFPKQPFVR